jgi:hypothetical protein
MHARLEHEFDVIGPDDIEFELLSARQFGKPGQPFVCFPLDPLIPDSLDTPYYRPLAAGETAPTLVPQP